MAYDQTSPEFLGQLKTFARGFLDWASQEGSEGHHPPSVQQHQQTLQQPPQQDINQPPHYAKKDAAGMLLMAPDGRALFVRRAANARDHAGEWSIPGGMTENDEDPWQTALRETNEEIGDCGVDRGQLLDHNLTGDLGFTTFGGKVGADFVPLLSDEHDGYQWATLDNAPQPLHSGLKATLDFAQDPLTGKGSKILSSMQSHYGPEKGKQVFYASKNAGKISGVDQPNPIMRPGRQDRTIGPHEGQPQSAFSANLDWASPRWDQGFQESQHQRSQTGQFSAGGGGGGGGGGFAAGSKQAQQYHMGEHKRHLGLAAQAKNADQQDAHGRAAIDHLIAAKHHGLLGSNRGGTAERATALTNRAMASSKKADTSGNDAWASPQWDIQPQAGPQPQIRDQASTGKTAEIESAVQGKVRDPQAVAAATRAKMIGRPALQAKAAAARREGGDEAALGQRFKVLDTRTGRTYDIDAPVASTVTPPRTGTLDPRTGQDDVLDPMTQPADKGRGPSGFQRPPTGGAVGGGGGMLKPRRPMGVNAGMGAMGGGPKYTHAIKMDYGGGVTDERKFTRPMPGAVAPEVGPKQSSPPMQREQLDWASPRWGQQDQRPPTGGAGGWGHGGLTPPQQPQDQGWPNARTAGPSAKGGRAGSAGRL